MPWYAKDAGAVAAVDTGMTALGGALGGPWGALGVTLGVAALSSMIE